MSLRKNMYPATMLALIISIMFVGSLAVFVACEINRRKVEIVWTAPSRTETTEKSYIIAPQGQVVKAEEEPETAPSTVLGHSKKEWVLVLTVSGQVNTTRYFDLSEDEVKITWEYSSAIPSGYSRFNIYVGKRGSIMKYNHAFGSKEGTWYLYLHPGDDYYVEIQVWFTKYVVRIYER